MCERSGTAVRVDKFLCDDEEKPNTHSTRCVRQDCPARWVNKWCLKMVMRMF